MIMARIARVPPISTVQSNSTAASTSADPAEFAEAELAISGDSDAIRAIWERYRRWVAAILLAHKPSFEDLDDLLQDVAATFVSRIDTVRDPGAIRPWLRVVAINVARAAGRSGRYRPRVDNESVDRRLSGLAPEGGELDEAAVSEQHRGLLALIERLPDEYREPLLLRTVRGLRSRQVAEILGISPATVDTRVARARTMLRTARQEMERDERDGGAGKSAEPGMSPVPSRVRGTR